MSFDEKLRRRVRSLCVTHGVSATAVSGYCSFALQVEKTRKRVRGRDLELLVGALVTRYVGLGLERKLLEAIASRVFNVVPAGHKEREEP
jgi:hypothetical protein